MLLSGRDEAIEMYRRLRAIGRQHLDGTLKHIDRSAFIEAARRLGRLSGKTIVADSEEEMTLMAELAVFGQKVGRSRAIDRYARAHPFPEDSDEARVLAALVQSRFHIVGVRGRHPVAGLNVKDIACGDMLWLMDESLEATSWGDGSFATRLANVGPFYMTTGAAVPVGRDTVHAALHSRARWAKLADIRRVLDDPDFPPDIYAIAVRAGDMNSISYGSVDEFVGLPRS